MIRYDTNGKSSGGAYDVRVEGAECPSINGRYVRRRHENGREAYYHQNKQFVFVSRKFLRIRSSGCHFTYMQGGDLLCAASITQVQLYSVFILGDLKLVLKSKK